MNVKEHVTLPPRTVYDPCLVCGERPTGLDYKPEYVRDNPEAVIMGVINPYPNPILDTLIHVGGRFTFRPCGHTVSDYELTSKHWQVTQYL